MQNDEWVHYSLIEKFLHGDYSLGIDIGSTFYTQGFLGMIFAKIFGFQYLPVLTIIVSLFSIYILFYILHKQQNLPFFISFLLSLLLLFNPIFFYSSIGFMIDNYSILFTLLSIYFFNLFMVNSKKKNILAFNISSLFGFFVKQSLIFLWVGASFYFFYKRRYRLALLHLVISVVILFIYYIYVPLTPVMRDQSFRFSNIIDFQYLFSLMFAIGVYMGAFFAPIFGIISLNHLKKLSRIKILFIALLSTSIAYICSYFYRAQDSLLPDFPFLPNVFTRKGYYPYALNGNKYHWVGFHDFFEWWYWGAALIIILAILLFIIIRKIKVNYQLILLVVYLGFLILSPIIYDRYLLPIFVFFLLVLKPFILELNKIYAKFLIVIFLVGLMYLDYFYASDFILWQKYIWQKSEELHDIGDVSATHAWNRYKMTGSSPEYKFTFDSPQVLNDRNWVLFEKKEIDFRFDPFIDSSIYLYKKDIPDD